MARDEGLLNLLWADRLMRELAAAGVQRVFIAPGSRSTPLTLAAARQAALIVADHFDERGLAFAALGVGRATGRPAAVITTSGTAVANLLPAVVEAGQDHVPLVLLTADRPPELRGSGANQTIEQAGLFGVQARYALDLDCPPDDGGTEAVAEAVAAARLAWAHGPVHLNLRLREPLQPGAPLPPRPAPEPPCDCLDGFALHPPPEDGLAEVRDHLRPDFRVWCLMGPGLHPLEQGVLLEVARRLRWVVLPDVLSGLRLEALEELALVHHHDLALLAPESLGPPPDRVLHFGGRMLSKRLGQYLAALPDVPLLHLHPHPGRMEVVPNRVRQVKVGALAAGLLHDAPPAVAAPEPVAASTTVARALEAAFAADDHLDEPWVARALVRLAPDRHGLFLGSSLPVREMEMYAAPRPRAPVVGGNRGASGIDGTLAAAAGFALGLNRPTTVLLGDLSALHDLNSLAFIAAQRVPLVVVILNNGGGGIFRFLPVARLEAEHGALWTTPHAWEFAHAAALFKLPYVSPRTRSEFASAYTAAVASGGPVVIEVRTDGAENHARQLALQDAVRRALRP
jgi:2-succinyl-5-enolpyruvyl-6-hydroxy-3-cyclohexene-1-carboxylate synthase